ncbi:UNVERIFIED_ORG: hypothetical protein FHT06_000450 [Xanthomonas campestris]|uniref:hypothetical protein n=1 Tax=Xanthomonas arboricola TaxID=56448 RepID=UPI0016B0BB20
MLGAFKAIIIFFLLLRGEKLVGRLTRSHSNHSPAEESSAEGEIRIAREHIRRIEQRVTNLERAGVKFERSSREVRRFKAYFVLSARASLSFKPDLFSVIFLFFIVASIAVIGLGIKSHSMKVLCEYLSYIFPLYAGLVAAGGLYLDKPLMRQVQRRNKSIGAEKQRRKGIFKRVAPDVACFQASAVLVLLSLLFFVGSKGAITDFYFAAFGLLGSFISVFSVAINYRNTRYNPTRGDIIFRPIAVAVMVVNIAASVSWLALIITGWVKWPQWLLQSMPWLQENMR